MLARFGSRRGRVVVLGVVLATSVVAFASAYASSGAVDADAPPVAVSIAGFADTIDPAAINAEAGRVVVEGPVTPVPLDENGFELKTETAFLPPEPPGYIPGTGVRVYPDTPEGAKFGLTGALVDQDTLVCKMPNGKYYVAQVYRVAGAKSDPFPQLDPKAETWYRPC